MDDRNTDEMNGKRPFEERVFARFDTVDSAIRNLDSRLEALQVRADGTNTRLQTLEVRADETNSQLQTLGVRADDTNSRLEKLEIRAYDAKPIWEQALKEIVDTKRDLSKRFSRIEAVVIEIRADLIAVKDRVERDVEDRLQKLERKLIQ